jgi:hypothetical protein
MSWAFFTTIVAVFTTILFFLMILVLLVVFDDLAFKGHFAKKLHKRLGISE